jgi:hypothetical protein
MRQGSRCQKAPGPDEVQHHLPAAWPVSFSATPAVQAGRGERVSVTVNHRPVCGAAHPSGEIQLLRAMPMASSSPFGNRCVPCSIPSSLCSGEPHSRPPQELVLSRWQEHYRNRYRMSTSATTDFLGGSVVRAEQPIHGSDQQSCPVGLDYSISPGEWCGLGSSLSDLFGLLPGRTLSVRQFDGAGPSPGVQGCRALGGAARERSAAPAGSRVRYEPADRLWLVALSRLIPRRRWGEVFGVTPPTARWSSSPASSTRRQPSSTEGHLLAPGCYEKEQVTATIVFSSPTGRGNGSS